METEIDELRKGEIGFMEFMIEKYNAKLSRLKATQKSKTYCWPMDWHGGTNPRLQKLDDLYRKNFNDEIQFYKDCIKECKRIIKELRNESRKPT